jgi:hypothetical protein
MRIVNSHGAASDCCASRVGYQHRSRWDEPDESQSNADRDLFEVGFLLHVFASIALRAERLSYLRTRKRRVAESGT